jgi:hypothetical protein
MVFKPNYNMQRAERNRAKQAKKDEKLREKEETAARRKAEIESGVEPSSGEDTNSGGTDAA